MANDMLWIAEGFVLDDAGNMISTVYVDLRERDDRTVIPSLVKGCRREYALEDGDSVLISKPERFREYGEGLIRDEQEGHAKKEEEFVTITAETPAEAAKRRSAEDMSDAVQLLDSGMSIAPRIEHTHSDRRKESKYFTFGKDFWIYCTSIKPDDSEWDSWKATLDDDYDHVSEIGRPAKFAEALARMVTEQIGPQGKVASLTGTNDGAAGARTKHKSQLVIHGPVLYTDRPYETLMAETDEARRLAATLFVKSATHTAQREYRFVVMNDGATEKTEETVLLKISGMMRDALKPTEGGLIRPSPSPEDMVGDDGTVLPRNVKGSLTPLYKRATTKRIEEMREEHRSESTVDEKVVASESKQEESKKENVATQLVDFRSEELWDSLPDGDESNDNPEQAATKVDHDPEEVDERRCDEDVVEEIAVAEPEWTERDRDRKGTNPVILYASGNAFKSLTEKFDNPAVPLKPSAVKTWHETACTPDEIATSFRAMSTLTTKLYGVPIEHRQDAASACWHATHCIRNILAQLGDIVESVWIDRDRFVVIRIKDSEKLKATGRVVVAPSGAYAYHFKSSGTWQTGGSEGWLGEVLFPVDRDIETFESFGWPPKKS